MSDLSPDEFVRFARMRAGLDPELPPDDDEPEVAATPEAGAVRSAQRDSAQDGSTQNGAVPDEASPDGASPASSGGVAGASAAATGGRDRGVWHWPAGSARMGGFEPGVAGVVTALRQLEAPGELDDDTLQDRTADLVRLHSLVTATLTAHVRVWDGRCLWGTDRSKSPSARLARDANCAKSTASSWVWLGRSLNRMPATAAALDAGKISGDHARRLAVACTDERLDRFLEAEETLIGHAVDLAGDFAGFTTAVARWEHITDDNLHDPTDPDDMPPGEKKQKTGRNCRLWDTDHGGDLSASLNKAGAAIVRTQLQDIVDELWRHDWNEARARLGPGATISEADLARTNRQRWADALVEMARRAGATRPGDQLPRPLITVHVTPDDMTGPIRETFNGVVLSRRDVADLIADEATWERIIYDATGQPVTLTSPQRTFTGLLRRAVQLRDRVCSHPTCDVDAERCHVDHIIEFTDGGPTNLDNARLLCPKHNLQRPGRGKTPPRGDGDRGDGDGDGDGDGH